MNNIKKLLLVIILIISTTNNVEAGPFTKSEYCAITTGGVACLVITSLLFFKGSAIKNYFLNSPKKILKIENLALIQKYYDQYPYACRVVALASIFGIGCSTLICTCLLISLQKSISVINNGITALNNGSVVEAFRIMERIENGTPFQGTINVNVVQPVPPTV